MAQHFEENEENFAELLDKSFEDIKTYEPGQLVKAEIISITQDTVFLQLSGKSEGVLSREELEDKDGELTVSEGDTIEAFFLYPKNGEMHFTTKVSGDKAGKAVLQNAFENSIPVEGLVDKEIKGGFSVKIGSNRAFCPFSQMGEKRVEDAKDFIGKNLTFKIIEFKENGRNILVSNRAILEEEKEKQIGVLKKELKEGMTVKGTVTSIRDFGAFVDLDGVQALLPISEISRERVNNIKQVLSVGDEVEARILKLDWQNERISLSRKALIADPWDTVQEKYKIDSRHEGTVVRVVDFGAFVSLEPGLDGLLHISELQGDSRDNNPRSYVKKGDKLTVQINSIDVTKKRISLKTLSEIEQDEKLQGYMDADSDSEETYNPFAAFVKGKR